ncbi:MAG: flavin reductase [Planctomycetaceae bacterium]
MTSGQKADAGSGSGRSEIRPPDSGQPNSGPLELVSLDTRHRIWDRFFMVAPLVVIGTKEPDGTFDLAPKHMVTALSWDNYFGFVCTPSHGTYQNIRREKVFTVSFPRADQVVLTSLSAAPRCDSNAKPALAALPTFAASRIDGVCLQDGSLFFECRLHLIIDGFGPNSLIAGEIIAARAIPAALRGDDIDDQDVVRSSPLLAYLAPGRFCEIRESSSFPFPQGFTREPQG